MKQNKLMILYIISVFSLFILWGCGNNIPTPVDIKSNSIKTTNSSNADISKNYTKQSFKVLARYRIIKNRFASNNQNEDDSVINNQIPKEIKDLNDTDIEISGYAFPIALEEGKCSALVLMSVLPNCCFGDNLKINQYIYIDALKDLKEIKSQQFLKVKGKLKVGMAEVSTWGDKFLYSMVADTVEFDKEN